jgi:kojibiose phosphorylase
LRLADAMYTGFDPRTKIFEQFRGFYQKRHVDLKDYESRHTAMDVILGHEEIQTTNVVKQADVVMAMYLLWNQFPPEVREANFRYYEPLTGHGSSLSPSIHALLAARFGNLRRAEAYLRQSTEIDLGNNMGNASGGVHAAAVGGLWQAIVFGFGGVDFEVSEAQTGGSAANETAEQARLILDPRMLPRWTRLSFPLQIRGARLHVILEPGSMEVRSEEGSRELQIEVRNGDRLTVGAGQRWLTHRRAEQWGPWQRQ